MRYRRRAWALTGAAWALAVIGGPVHAADCAPPANPPTLKVTVDYGEPRLDHTMGRDELGALARGSRDAPHATQARPLGLTSARLKSAIRTGTQALEQPDGTTCVWPDSAIVEIGFAELTVYVARDYRPGSCAYAQTLDHEMTHVAINRRAVEAAVPKLERALAEAIREAPFLRVRAADDVRSAYTNHIDRRLSPVLDDMEARRRRENAAIDTPDSYRAMSRRCDDW